MKDHQKEAEEDKGRDSVRVQLDFHPDAYEELLDLKLALRLKTKADVIRYALRVMRWTVEQSREGNKILVDSMGRLQQVVFPFLPQPEERKHAAAGEETREYLRQKGEEVRESAQRAAPGSTEWWAEVITGQALVHPRKERASPAGEAGKPARESDKART